METISLTEAATFLNGWYEAWDNVYANKSSADARKATVAAYIADFIAKYEARFAKQSLAAEHENAMARDLTWEIREALLRALHSLHKEILAVDTTSEEDDD